MGELDWAISMGIFLVAIVSIFVFLKPATVPLYGEDSLVPIVDRGFSEDVYWSIKRVPLFIGDSCGSGAAPTWEIDITHSNIEWGSNNNENYVSGAYQKGIYWLVYYPRVDDPKDLRLSLSVTNCGSDTYLGTIESIKGINSIKLDGLKGKYDDKKLEWGFPLINDFAIYRDDIEEPIIGKPPLGQRNIFAQEMKDFIVTEDGGRVPVSVKIFAW